MKASADSGFLVAFGNRRGFYHSWALRIAAQITEPLLTCEAVLAETAFHLGDARMVMQFVEEGLVRPAFLVMEHIQRLTEPAARFAGRLPIWRTSASSG